MRCNCCSQEEEGRVTIRQSSLSVCLQTTEQIFSPEGQFQSNVVGNFCDYDSVQ